MQNKNIKNAIKYLQNGKIIAYPTEAVYGLGCDPFNEEAVLQLLRLKNRAQDKGLILITDSWQRVSDLTMPIPKEILETILCKWPGPYTQVFPANLDKVPSWIRGKFETIALRVTDHPIAKSICHAFAKPVVSTSANIEGYEPARTYEEVRKYFPHCIDYILEGEVGDLLKPTPIYDALTGKTFRT